MKELYLLIHNKSITESLNAENCVTVTNKLGLKNKLLLSCEVVNNKGQVKKIVEVKKIKNVNSFWKFEFFNPLIYVTLVLEDTKKDLNVSELKTLFKKSFKSNSEIWESNIDFKNFQIQLEKSKSIKELFELINF